jgi:hypothetical protein
MRRFAIPLLCTAVLGLGAVVYALIFGGRVPRDRPILVSPPAPAARPQSVVASRPAPTETVFELVTVAGLVEVRRDGAWQAATTGSFLREGEAVRTATDAGAVIRAPSGDAVELRARVELEVTELSRSVTELTLTRGKVKAAPGSQTERFQISSGTASASGPGGSRFTVYTDPRGAVAVASEVGEIKVIGNNTAVTLPERTQTVVEPGQAPGDPVAIPEDVFLAVSWPAREVHAPSATLRGKAAPGTIVLLNGQQLTTGPDGTFTTRVDLRDGKNPLELTAESLTGMIRKERASIVAYTKGPPLEVDPTRMYDTPDGGLK